MFFNKESTCSLSFVFGKNKFFSEGMSEGADGEKSEPHSSSETAKVNEGGIVEKTIPRNSELCILTTAKMPKLKMDKKSSIDDETYFFLIV